MFLFRWFNDFKEEENKNGNTIDYVAKRLNHTLIFTLFTLYIFIHFIGIY